MNVFTWIWNFIQSILMFFHISKLNEMNYTIEKTWDDIPVEHEPVRLEFSVTQQEDLLIKIDAPFFNDPVEPNYAKNATFDLWNYEGEKILKNLKDFIN